MFSFSNCDELAVTISPGSMAAPPGGTECLSLLKAPCFVFEAVAWKGALIGLGNSLVNLWTMAARFSSKGNLYWSTVSLLPAITLPLKCFYL